MPALAHSVSLKSIEAIFGNLFSPAALFAAGEVGAWFDPSDFSTMFQDSAGSTPVTAVEQPVGLIRDKSGRGNHASQATSTSRPVLSARVNLLTYTEQFDNAAWLKLTGGTGVIPVVTANAGTSPIGTATADRIVFDRGAGTTAADVSRLFQDAADPAGGTCTMSVWLRSFDGVSSYTMYMLNGSGTATITVTGTWQRFSLASTGTSSNFQILTQGNITQQTADLLVWGADFRNTDQVSFLPAYQRVVTGTTNDYDTAGFPLYLKFDGTDDSLATGSINFSATDKMTVFAGVRKVSDAAQAVVAGLGNITQTGAFEIFSPTSAASANLNFAVSAATTFVQAQYTNAAIAAPYTGVLTGIADLSLTNAEGLLRINGTQQAASSGDAGTGNFRNDVLQIGRRGGASFPFNGNLYGLIVRGAATTAASITSTETWLNGKTGAY